MSVQQKSNGNHRTALNSIGHPGVRGADSFAKNDSDRRFGTQGLRTPTSCDHENRPAMFSLIVSCYKHEANCFALRVKNPKRSMSTLTCAVGENAPSVCLLPWLENPYRLVTLWEA
jgi:hypothetical protein